MEKLCGFKKMVEATLVSLDYATSTDNREDCHYYSRNLQAYISAARELGVLLEVTMNPAWKAGCGEPHSQLSKLEYIPDEL